MRHLPSSFFVPLFVFLLGAALAPAQMSQKQLKEMQTQVQTLVKNAMPATVSLRGRAGSGSGVIIDKEGTILSAQHVSANSKEMTVIFPDGKTAMADVLGGHAGRDISMLKIKADEEAPEGGWPFVKIGDSDKVEVTTIVVAMGHPGGFDIRRTPPVRIGRAYMPGTARFIVSDCTLIGGDSGGPLFNLAGEVIGIHSSIGESLGANNHVPVNVATENWDRMLAGETWGGRQGNLNPDTPVMGVQLDQESADGVGVIMVFPDSPAANAGMQNDDKIIKFDGKAVKNYEAMMNILSKKKPGNKVKTVVLRGGKEETLTITLGRRGDFYGRPGGPRIPENRDDEGDDSEREGESGESGESEEPEAKPAVYLGVVMNRETETLSILEVRENSPAAKAGLKAGDEILKIGNKEIKTFEEMAGVVRSKKAGDKLPITIRRSGEKKEIVVTLGGSGASAKPESKPSPDIEKGKRPDRPDFDDEPDSESGSGSEGKKPSPAKNARPYLGVVLDESGGKLTIIEALSGSPAAKAGLKEGDVITHAGNKAVKSIADLAGMMKVRKPGQKVNVKIKRGDESKTIAVTLGGVPGEGAAEAPAAPKEESSAAPEKPKAEPTPEKEVPSNTPGYLGAVFKIDAEQVVVSRVVDGTAAAKAKLLPGDIVLGVGSEDVRSLPALAKLIGGKKAGEKIMLRMQRGDEKMALGVVLGERP